MHNHQIQKQKQIQKLIQIQIQIQIKRNLEGEQKRGYKVRREGGVADSAPEIIIDHDADDGVVDSPIFNYSQS